MSDQGRALPVREPRLLSSAAERWKSEAGSASIVVYTADPKDKMPDGTTGIGWRCYFV